VSLSDILWGLFAAVITAALLAWIGWSIKTWLRINIADPIAKQGEAIEDVQRRQEQTGTEVSATAHLVKYHLGPNGETKPLHHRVSDIERANGIEATSPKDWMKDDWGQE
jgi:hypothetical protein